MQCLTVNTIDDMINLPITQVTVNTIDDMLNLPVTHYGTILYVREVDELFVNTPDGKWHQINRPHRIDANTWEFPGPQEFTIYEETLEESITFYA